jgi:hypothetical protein
VSTASATAAALTGGAGVLSMIDDNTYQALEELKRAVGFLQTIENDTMVMSQTLKNMRSGGGVSGGGSTGSASASGSSGGFASGFLGGGSGGTGSTPFLDPNSAYVWNRALQPGGAAWSTPYSPLADYLLNGNKSALGAIGSAPTDHFLVASGFTAGNGAMPVSYTPGSALQQALTRQAGFDSGGYIHPGDSQRVQLFKRPDEAVAVLRPEQREAVGKAMDGGKVDRSIKVGDIHIHVTGDIGSRQSQLALRDAFGRRLAEIASRV